MKFTIFKFKLCNNFFYHNRLILSDPPVFSFQSTSRVAEEGTSVSFVFRPSTTGNPSVYDFHQCSHYVGTTFLRHISYTKSSSEVSFTIQNASITDRGKYMCNVTNRIPNSVVTASSYLDIKSKQVSYA